MGRFKPPGAHHQRHGLTTRFWHGVIGTPLVASIGNEAFRHYFFDVGSGATVAFFEYPGHTVEHIAIDGGHCRS